MSSGAMAQKPAIRIMSTVRRSAPSPQISSLIERNLPTFVEIQVFISDDSLLLEEISGVEYQLDDRFERVKKIGKPPNFLISLGGRSPVTINCMIFFTERKPLTQVIHVDPTKDSQSWDL